MRRSLRAWLWLAVGGPAIAARLGRAPARPAPEARGRSLLSSRAPPSPARIRMRNFQGLQYHATLLLGGQPFAAIFDTGSFETLVMSSQCEPCEALPGVATYDSASSSTFADGGGGARVHEYGSGPVLARQDVETACIGGEGDEVSLCAQRVPFWQVLDHNLSVWEGDVTAFSAIVGLGHPRSLEDVQAAGASSDSLLERLGVERFGVCLQPGPGASGWLDVSPPLGPHFTEVPVVGTAYWAVTLTGIALGDVGADLCSPSCGALVDTGFSLIGAPAAAIAALSPVLGSIAEDCSNLLELPTLQFRLGGALFELPPSAYVLEPRHLGVCAPAFMEVDMVSQFGPAWIFGLPFFRRYYTVFDRTGPRLHVAHAGLGCRPAPHYLATAGVLRAGAARNRSAPRRWRLPAPPPGARAPPWPRATGGRLTL